jgi:hypothetical protein
MIKSILLISLIVFSSVNFCFSQKGMQGTAPILFRGVVLDASSHARLGSSQILINRSSSAIIAEDGTFSFYAYKKDTVLFSMLGYKPVSLIVSDTLSGREFLTGVYLETDTLLIGEVIIVPKLTNLKAEMMNPRITSDARLENARSNISVASYQGRTGQAKMGDPGINYEYLRKKQRIDAYEKGGIPSDKILGLSPLLLIPAAYLLIHGLPETPAPPKPQISSKDLDELQKKYLESLQNRNRKLNE